MTVTDLEFRVTCNVGKIEASVHAMRYNEGQNLEQVQIFNSPWDIVRSEIRISQ
jgi:hypothetical protein